MISQYFHTLCTRALFTYISCAADKFNGVVLSVT